MNDEIVELKELEIAFYRFNKYADTILKSDYWSFKNNLVSLMTFCENNRVIRYILDPIATNKKYNGKSLKELVVSNGKLAVPENFEMVLIVYHILKESFSGNMDGVGEFITIFNETNKNNAVFKFNNYITRPLLLKLSEDMQLLYNKLRNEKTIKVDMLGVYEGYRSKVAYDNVPSNSSSVEKDDGIVVNKDSGSEFRELIETVNSNPRIPGDTKINICKDLEDIQKELFCVEVNKGNIFNLINNIGLKSNWTIGKMDEIISHPVISELVKIWALRQIGVSK